MNDSAPDPSAASDLRIIPLTAQSAEIRLDVDGSHARIGNVGSVGPHWWWQHRDGERSSPVAESRAEAARALAQYHRVFKQSAPAATPVRRLLFG
jgi:hypothetical protein